MLRRISVFAAPFTAAAAQTSAPGGRRGREAVPAALGAQRVQFVPGQLAADGEAQRGVGRVPALG